ncbi:twin-arginine translocase TatA/TatE family subunit [Spongisporangium articulatum]|uniref:Twin-arginine translocase TatA/TatE family subunit n=1 Tax=Spongisporangium articulatum TaxID=3362603 RepID=A0ABW8AQZ0_9ACTN
MFGISAPELLVLVVVAAIFLGPERLPDYAQSLARLIKELRRMAAGATEQVKAEMGPEFDDIDWRKLDPRQYDPRRIVREALSDAFDPDDPLGMKQTTQDVRDTLTGAARPAAQGPTDVQREAEQAANLAAVQQAQRVAEAKARAARTGEAPEAAAGPDYDPDAT